MKSLATCFLAVLALTACGTSSLDLSDPSLGDAEALRRARVPVITSPSTAAGTVGVAFSYTITASRRPTSFGAAGLPAGLQVDAATGLISGTPTASGAFAVEVSATNDAGTGALTVTLSIAPAAPAPPSGPAASLAWDPSPTVGVTGYRVYWGSASAAYTDSLDVGLATAWTFDTLPSGSAFFAVTARDAAGTESIFSNEVSKTIP
jgi:hypothetical protein